MKRNVQHIEKIFIGKNLIFDIIFSLYFRAMLYFVMVCGLMCVIAIWCK